MMPLLSYVSSSETVQAWFVICISVIVLVTIIVHAVSRSNAADREFSAGLKRADLEMMRLRSPPPPSSHD